MELTTETIDFVENVKKNMENKIADQRAAIEVLMANSAFEDNQKETLQSFITDEEGKMKSKIDAIHARHSRLSLQLEEEKSQHLNSNYYVRHLKMGSLIDTEFKDMVESEFTLFQKSIANFIILLDPKEITHPNYRAHENI